MVNVRKIAIIFLLVLLPALIAAKTSKCKVTVSSTLGDRGSSYYTYKGTITNVGTLNAGDVILVASGDVSSVSDLRKTDDGYQLPESQVEEGGLEVGDAYSFTYTVAKGKSVKWTASCSASTPTTAPTSRPSKTAKATTKATTAATTKATSKATTAATTKATTAATTKATTKATTAATTKATTAATTKATTKATTAATTKATTAATTKATTAATTKATSAATTAASSTGKKCSSGWWAPAPMTTWQWQLTGTIDQTVDVQMYDIDLFDNTAATISSLHDAGRAVICYFSTQYENWRSDASSFTSAVLGNNLDDWAGEKYVDIRSSVVRAIMQSRLDMAVTKGCDGVEPDNVDGYEADSGFSLTAADQLDFNEFIASEAHSRGLSVGLKNDLDQAKTLQPYFDWALNEQCYEYSECSTLTSFITAGKAVFNTEYSGTASKVCTYMVGLEFSSLIKDLDLDASITAECCTYATGGCSATASYTCKTA